MFTRDMCGLSIFLSGRACKSGLKECIKDSDLIMCPGAKVGLRL
jgi:hypothetical protein